VTGATGVGATGATGPQGATGAGGTPADGSITLAKLADLTTQRVIGRNSAGTGVPQEVSLSQLLDWASNTQGAILTRGASGWVALAPPANDSYLSISGGGTSNPVWVDETTLLLKSPDTTTSAEFRSLLSDETGTGSAYFQGGELGTPSGGTLTSCTGLPPGGITMATARLLGRTTAGSGAAQEITVGSGLSLTGGTLSATGGGSITVQDEGAELSTSVTTLNFTGAGVTATGTTTVTVNVPGGSASAGGSATQVQYNSAGALAGAANVEINAENLQLTAPSTAPGAADASSLLVYPVGMADRFMLAMRGPIGAASLIQPSLFTNNVSIFNPQTGTTGTGSNAFHAAWTSNGTVTHPNPDSVTLAGRFRRTRYANVVTTANQQLGPRMNATSDMAYWRGNAANAGGFFFYTRFFVTYPASTVRIFAGLQGTGATTSICTSDTVGNNTCGLWHDTTDPSSGSGAFNIVTRNGTTTTKTPINLANAIATATVYDFMMFHEPNGSTLFYRLDDVSNSVTYTGSTTSTLPVNTVFMSPQVQMSNGTANLTADTSAMNVVRIYVESPY
jgi:hypothetical protein